MRPLNKRAVNFKKNPNGTYDVTIQFRGVRLRTDGQDRLWWIIDHEGKLRQRVDCEGMIMRPNLVVKLYCKPSPLRLERLKRFRVWQKIRSRSPLILG